MAPARDPRWPELPTHSRRALARDIDDELEEWIESRAAELRARGMSPSEALCRARQDFGDLDATRRYCLEQDLTTEHRHRMSRCFDELRQDVHGAVRGMCRAPTLTAVLLLTLALGIGATSAIYAVTHAVLLRPLPWRDDARLVQLHTTELGERQPMGQLSTRALLRIREQSRTLSAIAGMSSGGGVITGSGEPERVSGVRVSANMLSVLGVAPAIGGWFPPGADSTGAEPVVVLTDSLWRRRFGADPAIIGQQLTLSGVSRRVVGVMPRGFVVPMAGSAELISPLDHGPVLRDEARSHKFRYLQAIGRIRDGVSMEAVASELASLYKGLATEHPDAYDGMAADPVPLREEITGIVRAPLIALAAASVVLLLITCANVASVLLARAVARQGEFVVRTALGAGRRRMVRQLVTESLVLSLAGGAAGVVVAFLGVRALRVIGVAALPAGFSFGLGSPALLLAVTASIVCGITFGIAPALMAGRLALRSAAMGGTRGTDTTSRMRLRRGLVVAQVSLSLALLAGAGLLARSLKQLMAVDLGYRTTGVAGLRLSLPGQRYDDGKHDVFWTSLIERLAAIPGVERVGVITTHPLNGSSGASLVVDGRPFAGDRPPEVRYAAVSDEYFRAAGIPLVAGRGFQSGDERADVRAVILSNATAKKFWGEASPLGSRIRLGPDPSEPWSTVVGVVGDIVIGTSGATQPAVYSSMRYDRWYGGDVIVTYAGSAPPANGIRRVVQELDPLLPTGAIGTIDGVRSLQLSDRRLPLQLIGAFGAFAVVLVALGLYGVGVNQVTARRRELGVRMALGASRQGILGMVLRDGLLTVLIGVAVGLPLALGLVSQLNEILFEVRPWDPMVLGGVILLLLMVGIAAALVPARRATLVDPADVLRGE